MRLEPKVNIIIPNYNRQKDVLECINSIKESKYFNFDITVVDDYSTDDSMNVLKSDKDITVIQHQRNRGPAAARNTGAKNTNGEIIVFIDNDVKIFQDTIEKFVEVFKSNKDIFAIVALPDKDNQYQNIFTKHFIMRVHYNYLNLPDFISHTCGTITAVKRKVFNLVGGYNEQLKTAGIEDDEFGLDIYNKGGKIYLDKNNIVVHNKHIGFLALIGNDMLRTIDRVFYLFRKSQLKSISKEKRFISTPIAHIISALIAPLIIFSFFLAIFSKWFLFPLLALLLIFYSFYSGYLAFIYQEKGMIFTLKIFFLLMVDMFFVHIALWWGVIQYICGRDY